MLTEQGGDPHIAGDLIFTRILPGLEVISLGALLVQLGPRECDLEHASGADISVLAPPLSSC